MEDRTGGLLFSGAACMAGMADSILPAGSVFDCPGELSASSVGNELPY
jgi:hypothetical protein